MAEERMLRFFQDAHLPDHLVRVSLPFCQLAEWIVVNVSAGPERTVALRKLLEAKDCAVRARLEAADVPAAPEPPKAPAPLIRCDRCEDLISEDPAHVGYPTAHSCVSSPMTYTVLTAVRARLEAADVPAAPEPPAPAEAAPSPAPPPEDPARG